MYKNDGTKFSPNIKGKKYFKSSNNPYPQATLALNCNRV